MLKDNICIRKFASLYLIIFCIIKVCSLTNIFEKLPINDIVFFIGCVIFILLLFEKKGKLYYPKILCIFILSVVISTIFNFDILTIKNSLFEIFYVFIVYNIARNYLDQKKYIYLIKIILIMSFVMISIFFVQYFELMNGSLLKKNTIAHIFFSNINGGTLLALLSIIISNYLYNIKQIKPSLNIFINIYFALFILISYSRTSILSLTLIIIYEVLDYYLNNKKKVKDTVKKIVVICAVVLIIALSCIILKKDYDTSNKFDNSIYKLENNIAEVTSMRYWMWKFSIRQLIDGNLFFGIKADFAENNLQNVDEKLLNNLSELQKGILVNNNIHNGYIQILIENGIVGLIIIMTYFTKIAKIVEKIDNKDPYNRYVKCFYLFYIIINLFENHIIFSNSIFVLLLWINIGMDTNIYQKMNEEKSKIIE